MFGGWLVGWTPGGHLACCSWNDKNEKFETTDQHQHQPTLLVLLAVGAQISTFSIKLIKTLETNTITRSFVGIPLVLGRRVWKNNISVWVLKNMCETVGQPTIAKLRFRAKMTPPIWSKKNFWGWVSRLWQIWWKKLRQIRKKWSQKAREPDNILRVFGSTPWVLPP